MWVVLGTWECLLNQYFRHPFHARAAGATRQGSQLHSRRGVHNQREGMGLLEYLPQVMPSLREEAHGGVLCTFSNRSASDRDKCVVDHQGRRRGPSIMYKITPFWVTPLLQPARRAAVLGQPSSLRPHSSNK